MESKSILFHKPNTPGLSFAYGDDCRKLKDGLTEILEFTAQALGTYTFSCCKKCGSRHGSVKGQIIVEPERVGLSAF